MSLRIVALISSISSFRRFAILMLAGSVAGLVGAAIATEWLIRSHVDPQEGFSAHATVFHTAKEKGTENAIFGDSVAARGFQASSWDFVNLGLGGESPFRTLIKIKAFFDERDAGQVILVAAPHTLVIDDAIDRGDFYASVFRHGKRPPLRIMELRNRFFAMRFWRRFLIEGSLLASSRVLTYGGLTETDPHADTAYAAQPSDRRLRAAEAEVDKYDRRFSSTDHQDKLFTETIRFLRGKGARVCLVTFPYSHSINQAAENSPLYGTISPTFFQALAQREGATYVNLMNALDSDDLFLNETHLNPLGARKITPEVLRRCFG